MGIFGAWFDDDDDDDYADYDDARISGSDTGVEHDINHNDMTYNEWCDDSLDSTKPETDSQGWFKLWN